MCVRERDRERELGTFLYGIFLFLLSHLSLSLLQPFIVMENAQYSLGKGQQMH